MTNSCATISECDLEAGETVLAGAHAAPEIAELPPSPLEPDVDTTEADHDDVGFGYLGPATVGAVGHRSWLVNAASLLLAVVLHAGMFALGFYVFRLGFITPPSIQFGQGDGAETRGRVNLAGDANLKPGSAAPQLDLPPQPPQEEMVVPPPPEAVAAPPATSTEPPPEVADEPKPDDRIELPTDSAIARSPTMEKPKRQWALADTPSAGAATTRPTTGPTTAPAEGISPGTTLASASSNTTQGGTAQPVSGTGHEGGQGGAATAGGGDDDTGRPGVPAGLPDGGLPQPRYPDVCKRRGEEGRVLLAVEVLEDGRVGDIAVQHNAGFPLLAESAVECLRENKVRFKPARRFDGSPIRSVAVVPYDFKLQRRR